MHSWSSGARKSRSGDALGGVQSPLWEQRNDETRLRRSCFCRMALSSRKTHQSCLITADYELGGDVLKRAKHNIRSVDAGEATVADPSTIPTGTQLVIQRLIIVAIQATAARPFCCCCAGLSLNNNNNNNNNKSLVPDSGSSCSDRARPRLVHSMYSPYLDQRSNVLTAVGSSQRAW